VERRRRHALVPAARALVERAPVPERGRLENISNVKGAGGRRCCSRRRTMCIRDRRVDTRCARAIIGASRGAPICAVWGNGVIRPGLHRKSALGRGAGESDSGRYGDRPLLMRPFVPHAESA
jgi:hypothetical protein